MSKEAEIWYESELLCHSDKSISNFKGFHLSFIKAFDEGVMSEKKRYERHDLIKNPSDT